MTLLAAVILWQLKRMKRIKSWEWVSSLCWMIILKYMKMIIIQLTIRFLVFFNWYALFTYILNNDSKKDFLFPFWVGYRNVVSFQNFHFFNRGKKCDMVSFYYRIKRKQSLDKNIFYWKGAGQSVVLNVSLHRYILYRQDGTAKNSVRVYGSILNLSDHL